MLWKIFQVFIENLHLRLTEYILKFAFTLQCLNNICYYVMENFPGFYRKLAFKICNNLTLNAQIVCLDAYIFVVICKKLMPFIYNFQCLTLCFLFLTMALFLYKHLFGFFSTPTHKYQHDFF